METQKRINNWIERLRNPKRIIKDGEPCGFHKGCLNHVSHPCEGCGRIQGKGEIKYEEINFK